jgi:hypothetical protein
MTTPEAAVPEGMTELQIPDGCLVCGGDLVVRLGAGDAHSYCAACHWLSRPHMWREGEAVRVVHPAGGVA